MIHIYKYEGILLRRTIGQVTNESGDIHVRTGIDFYVVAD